MTGVQSGHGDECMNTRGSEFTASRSDAFGKITYISLEPFFWEYRV